MGNISKNAWEFEKAFQEIDERLDRIEVILTAVCEVLLKIDKENVNDNE